MRIMQCPLGKVDSDNGDRNPLLLDQSQKPKTYEGRTESHEQQFFVK